MGEADAFAFLVLRSGTAEQLEYPFVIFRSDAAAIVLDLENGAAAFALAADFDDTGHIVPRIFTFVSKCR
jgi:hypothetical protein